MPLIRIDILEGRPVEVRHELIRRVSEVVAEILDSPIERVRVLLTELPPDHWGIGGVPAAVARRDEVEARRAAAS